RGRAIERECASSLADHLSGARMTWVEVGRIGIRVRTGPRVTQFDDLLFRAGLPRSDHHLIEDFPLHRLVSAQSVRLALPDASLHIANHISGEGQGHTARR